MIYNKSMVRCIIKGCDTITCNSLYCSNCTDKKEKKILRAQKKARKKKYENKVQNPITNYFKKKEKK